MKKIILLAAVILLLISSFTGYGSADGSDRAVLLSHLETLSPAQPETEIEIFPNPVTESRLTISSAYPMVSVQILNITGKIVFTQEFQPATGRAEVDLNKPEKGIYLVRISFSSNEIHTEKIMVK